MKTYRVNIADKNATKFVEYLKNFKEGEVEIIGEDTSYLANKKELESEFEEIQNGKAEFDSFEKFVSTIEKVVNNPFIY